MYDDLSLDYTYDHSFNLDEDYASYTYDDLDEDDDRARDTHDFQELAYQHYAWRYSERLADSKIKLHQVPLWREVEPETSYRRELITFGRGKSKGFFFVSFYTLHDAGHLGNVLCATSSTGTWSADL